MPDRIPLTRLPELLMGHGFEDLPTYPQIWSAAVRRAIPAKQSATGRWTFSPDDLEAIATGLGLSPAEHAA